MSKIIIIVLFILVPFLAFSQTMKETAVVNVETYIHHISDINFRDQEYKIELWLYLRTKSPIWALDSLANQFAVADAKNLVVNVIPQYQRPNFGNGNDTINRRRLVKINCTIIQNWCIEKYPFDKQKLSIRIYNLRPIRWLRLVPAAAAIKYAKHGPDLKDTEIENGWFFEDNSIVALPDTCQDIFVDTTMYSAIRLQIPMTRKNGLSLFLKLFIGMYISFFVAFIAFFIHVKHFEPRFGLPVGGLFAAIGNKYIMESILPESSEYTIVDTLHTFTIIAILLIILFSAISLNLSDLSAHWRYKAKIQRSFKIRVMEWIDKYGKDLIIITYVGLNIFFGLLKNA